MSRFSLSERQESRAEDESWKSERLISQLRISCIRNCNYDNDETWSIGPDLHVHDNTHMWVNVNCTLNQSEGETKERMDWYWNWIRSDWAHVILSVSRSLKFTSVNITLSMWELYERPFRSYLKRIKRFLTTNMERNTHRHNSPLLSLDFWLFFTTTQPNQTSLRNESRKNLLKIILQVV